jgi:hypothetical protein
MECIWIIGESTLIRAGFLIEKGFTYKRHPIRRGISKTIRG